MGHKDVFYVLFLYHILQCEVVNNMKKDYLNLEGLSHFFNQLLSLFAKKEDVITEEEIDEICGANIYAASEVLY